MPSGKVVSSETNIPLPGVTVWQMSPDGTSAEILGYAGPDGSFDVSPDPGFSLMFALDGYDSVNRPGLNGPGNIVAMDPDTAVTVTIKKNSWLLIVAALLGLFMLDTKKKR
jgi:hypothetical protein